MLGGAKIGIERVVVRSPPPPQPPVVRKQPPARRAKLQLGLTSETIVFSSEAPLVQALGAWGSLDTSVRAEDDRLRLGGWLTIALRLPLRATALPIGVELKGVETRLVPRLTARLTREVRFEAGAGPGIDFMEATAIANVAGATLVAPKVDVSFVIRSVVGVRLWRVLGVLLVADVDVTRHDYVFEWSGARAVPLSPFAVRPALALEASF
jgi:hypothetical protein